MKKILMTWAAVFCCAMTVQAQLLYKISGGGLTQPSYILGSNHTAAISFVDSIPGLRRVMNDTQQVYLESNESAESSSEIDTEMDQYVLLPDGMLLDSLLTADEMQRLTAFMIDSCKIDADEVHVFFDYKPLPLAIFLYSKFDSYKKAKETNGLPTFDDYFQKEALAQGKEVGGLESLTSQLKAVFQAPTLERQKAMLMWMVDHQIPTEQKGCSEETYYSQDLEAIRNQSANPDDDPRSFSSEELFKMVAVRNLAWMKKIPSVMSRKSTLFVVGCLHLPGPDGVLNLLRQAGYTVEAVKK
jgi:uncharacterized protein YbaP (TraB family)